MAKRKEVSVAKMLGKLTPKQVESLAEQYNGGLGSGLSPEAYKKKYDKTAPAARGKKGKK